MRAEEIDDPFSELSASACNLLADSIGVRYCGFATLDRAVVRAASSEFMRLPRSARDQTVRAICRVVADAQSGEDEISSDVLMRAPADDAVGGTTVALFFPETEMVAFAVEPPGREVALSPFRRAAVSALPIIYKASDLQVERHRLVEEHGLLAHVGSLAKIGGWEQNIGTGRLTWSPELFAIHGLEPHGDITLDRMLALYPSPAREKLSLEMERAASEGTGFDLTTPLTTPGGDRRVVRTLGRTRVGPTGRQLYGIAQDVTQELAVERRLWWAANHDPVTSLPNRLLFQDRIAVAIRRARREERTLALVLVEVSDFARLTERSGYTVPDKNMMEIADRLVSVMRESDTIARISIDEFAILLSDVDSEELLGPAMDRLNSQFAEMRREEVTGDGLVMSVGIAFFPTHASSEEELLRAGEMALARAKRKLDQGVVVFDQELADDAARRRETVLAQARESLKKGEFVPYYQPQIDIDTNEVVGVEALVRWRTPDMILDAKDFAYALDDHEIGSRVGRAVLDQVIADIARLRAITDRPFRVSVNASRTEVLRNDFLETFLEKTHAGNLKPKDFIIEITEDVIIGVDDKTLHEKISYLVSSGVEFSLDDFGTGYASLIHITSFPVSEIKIDKQFIFDIERDRRKRAIVRGILQIAQSMGLNVIAEGVETSEQAEALRSIGCRYAQGYLYAFPVPFEQFAEMLDPPG